MTKTVDHQMIAWPEQALKTYKLFVMLDRCKLEDSMAMAMLSKTAMIDLQRSRTIEGLKEDFYQYLLEQNQPCRVETSDNLIEFKPTIMNFRDVTKFLMENDSFSLTYYPTHYPTQESHDDDIEREYARIFGK